MKYCMFLYPSINYSCDRGQSFTRRQRQWLGGPMCDATLRYYYCKLRLPLGISGLPWRSSRTQLLNYFVTIRVCTYCICVHMYLPTYVRVLYVVYNFSHFTSFCSILTHHTRWTIFVTEDDEMILWRYTCVT